MYQPQRILIALKKIQREHPLSRANLVDQASLSSDLAQMLRNRIKELNSSENIRNQLETPLKPMLPVLLLDPDANVKRLVIEYFELEGQYLTTEQCWKAYAFENTPGLSQKLSGILLNRTNLNDLQRALIRLPNTSGIVELLSPTLGTLNLFFETAKVQKTPLAKSTQNLFFMSGDLSLWKWLQEDLEELLLNCSDSELTQLLEALYEGYGGIPPTTFVENLLAVRALQYFRERNVSNYCSINAREWVERLFKLLDLSDFFQDGSSDRFQFWMRYLDRAVSFNKSSQRRLFIEFPTFGVLEIDEVGNAAYIFELADFEYIHAKSLNGRRYGHSALRSGRPEIDRIVHHGRWQHGARLTLDRLLRS